LPNFACLYTLLNSRYEESICFPRTGIPISRYGERPVRKPTQSQRNA